MLVPFVCGWIWKFQDQIQWAAALLKDWEYVIRMENREQSAISVPPLVNHLLGFSSTAVITWVLSPHLVSALSQLLLAEEPFLDHVIYQMIPIRPLMDVTSLVVGWAERSGMEDQTVHIEQVVRRDPKYNVFGLPLPHRCGPCQKPVAPKYEKGHKDNKHTLPDRVSVICGSCKALTPYYRLPKGVVRKSNVPDALFWNLPVTEPDWNWLPSGTVEHKTLENPCLDM